MTAKEKLELAAYQVRDIAESGEVWWSYRSVARAALNHILEAAADIGMPIELTESK